MSESSQSLAIEQIIAGDDRAALEAARRSRKIRTIGVMVFVTALLLAGMAFVGYNVWDVRAAASAKVDYEEAYEGYLASVSALDESLGGVSEKVEECRGSVADQSVCDNLERVNAQGLELSNTKLEKADIHDKTTDEIRGETRRVVEARSIIEQARETLLAALDPVSLSQVDKVQTELDEAVEAAEKAIAEAQKVVDENKDEVSDERIRQAAIEAIKAVRTQVDGANAVSGGDTVAYVAATQSLDEAVTALNAKVEEVKYSHEVWEREKREAEARESASARAAEEARRAEEEGGRQNEVEQNVEYVTETEQNVEYVTQNQQNVQRDNQDQQNVQRSPQTQQSAQRSTQAQQGNAQNQQGNAQNQ